MHAAPHPYNHYQLIATSIATPPITVPSRWTGLTPCSLSGLNTELLPLIALPAYSRRDPARDRVLAHLSERRCIPPVHSLIKGRLGIATWPAYTVSPLDDLTRDLPVRASRRSHLANSSGRSAGYCRAHPPRSTSRVGVNPPDSAPPLEVSELQLRRPPSYANPGCPPGSSIGQRSGCERRILATREPLRLQGHSSSPLTSRNL